MGIEDLVGATLTMGGGRTGLMRAVTGLIAGGGLAGLVGKLRDGGLGDVAGSWVGKGDNRPASADQLKLALGDDAVRRVAADAGVSHGEAADGLAELLPKVVDQLTPDGTVPAEDDIADALGRLKGLLG